MSLKQRIDPGVKRTVARLVENDHQAYVVGGAVRDLLLGIDPKDYDIATSATPEQILQVFGRRRCRIIGRRFRLAHVYTQHNYYEVSTFRREPTEQERRGRKDDDGVMIWRDNVYGTQEQDTYRRDFTVNAIFFDPVGDGGIIDLVDGVADLRAGLVRSIGRPDVRMEEDPVRMLRALKLVGQYGFTLEDELGSCMEKMAHRISHASRARLFEELLKILGNARACQMLEACADYGLLTHYWPGLAQVWDAPCGERVRRLLRERGNRISAGEYSSSKALGLATACLPAVAAALGCADTEPLWEHRAGIEIDCREAVRGFYYPFTVSRYLTARIRDIMLLLPSLARGIRRKRVMRHPEYRYGRELLSLLAQTESWGTDVLARWPPAANEHVPRQRGRGGGRGRRAFKRPGFVPRRTR